MIRRRAAAERPPAPEALQVDEVRVVAIGTALWIIALIGLIAFRESLADAGRTWWIYTCLPGIGLGVIGIIVCRRRARVRRGR